MSVHNDTHINQLNVFFHQDQLVRLLIDPVSGDIVDANTAAVKFYGYNIEQLTQMNIQQISSISPEEIYSEMQTAKELKRNYIQFQHKLANEEIREVEVYSTPVHIGKQKRILSVIHDVSLEKKALKELSIANARYDMILEATSVGIWDWDLVTNALYYSSQWSSMLGYSHHEIEANMASFVALLHPEDKESTIKALEKLISTKATKHEITFRLLHKNKHWVHILRRAKVHFDQYNKPIRMIGADININSIKQEEEKAKEMRSKLTTTFDLLDVGVFITNAQDEVIEYNRAFSSITGLKKAQVQGKSLHNLPWVLLNKEQKLLLDVDNPFLMDLNSSSPFSKEIGIKHRNKIRWVLVNISKMCYKDCSKVITMIDLTEEIENQQQLKKAIAAKEKIFSIIAHDLRSPLSAISTLSNLAKSELIESENPIETADHFLKLIHESSACTYELLNNLLNWSLSQTNRIDFQPIRLDVCQEVKSELSQLKANCVAKKISTIIDIEPDLSIHADKSMVETILRNLISNAIKFTHKEGQIVIKAISKNNYAHFSIQDNGIGIPLSKLQTLFDVDNNYHSLGTDGEKGTGLGLVLCKEFIEKHGGEIHVESEFGQFTRFDFDLPLN